MSTLAIKGHPTRGREVIEILEMLDGADIDSLYYIFKDSNKIYHCRNTNTENVTVYTLEEFEEKFPYKVGDKVSSRYLKNYKIEKAEWESCGNRVLYKLQGEGWYRKEELQPYTEETMEEPKELIIGFTKDDNGYWELNINKDYEIKEIEGKFKIIKKQSPYPKTYEECCKILNHNLSNDIIAGYKYILLENFQKLLICCDAYWKIAGEQMGLDKPWEPDYDSGVNKYGIISMNGAVQKSNPTTFWERHLNKVLEFPTEEMRDAFFEDFKELIEQCKELL